MKSEHVLRLPSLFAVCFVASVWQGCDDNSGKGESPSQTEDAGLDGSDTSEGGKGGASAGRGGSQASAGRAGRSGTAGESEAGSGGDDATGSGSTAGAGGGGKGGGGSGGGGKAGASGKPAGDGGKGGAGQGGSEAGSGGAGRSGAGSGGAAGEEEGGSGGTGQGGTGGVAGEEEGGTGGMAAGSGAEAGSGGAGEPAGEVCGSRGSAVCADDQFCNTEPDSDCGETDRGGTCEDKPEVCIDVFEPVCGCDNRTHANVCSTHAAGISVQHSGLCTPEECDAAGGTAKYSDGASTPECGQGDEVWNISGGDEPVICCLPSSLTGRTCGGIVPLECEVGEFCNFEMSAGGQGCDGSVSDAAGVCQVTPYACTTIYDPVCGCDKRSYSNACEAHANGQSVLHEGACTEIDCASVAGRVSYGTGPAAMCAPGEREYTYVVDSSGSMAIEGAICCVLDP